MGLLVLVNQRRQHQNPLLVDEIIKMKMANVFAVMVCAYFGYEGSAFSMQIRMAYQRYESNEFNFVRMDRRNLNEFYACDPDGYYHRITKRDVVGKEFSKILKIEWNQVLLESPYVDGNGVWLLKKHWKKIDTHLDANDKCPLTKDDRKILKLPE
jgi:hypothetical protein